MKHYLFLCAWLALHFTLSAQRNCSTMELLEAEILQDPERLEKLESLENHFQYVLRRPAELEGNRNVIQIPVVVHVLYRTSEENISEEQILSQIQVLNEDFMATNSDKLFVPQAFRNLVGNPSIQFVLAKQMPLGVPTSGITRKYTSRTTWGKTNDIKSSSLGGVNPWNSSNYMNIWVCNIGNGLLGDAQFPGGNPYTDGIVVDYRAFGTTGAVKAPFDKGRTATHEVAHWLNLRHIWGDQYCGSDHVDDTPQHNAANYGCPTSPHISSCSTSHDEMTMNFMDYTDDQCMYMFSAEQGTRMRSLLSLGGARESLTMSPGTKLPASGSCPLPQNIAVSDNTTNGVKISWNSVSTAMYYTLEYKLPTSSIWTRINTTTNFIALSNLKEATSYQYRLMISCSELEGRFSSISTFNTLSSAGCLDLFEPNDSRTATKSIVPGKQYYASISSNTDQDWFKFTNSSLQKNVKVVVADLPANYKVELYRGTQLVGTSSNEGLSSELIVYNNGLSATVFYVKVVSAAGDFSKDQCYSIQVDRSSTSYLNEQFEGLNRVADASSLQIFPNPADDMVNVFVQDFKTTGYGNVSLYDVLGNIHFERAIKMAPEGISLEINVADLKEGLYFVHYSNASEKLTNKLFINK